MHLCLLFWMNKGYKNFYLSPKKKKIMYQYAFSNIFGGRSCQKPDKMPEEIFEKVKTAFRSKEKRFLL